MEKSIRRFATILSFTIMAIVAGVLTTTDIHASSYGNIKATSKTIVQGKTTKIQWKKSIKTVKKSKVKWTTSNKKIVKISKIAKNKKAVTIKGMKKGKATITLKYQGKKVGSVKITVKKAATKKATTTATKTPSESVVNDSINITKSRQFPDKTENKISEEQPQPDVVESEQPDVYVPKYTYEVSVLNKFDIYPDVPIVLYIKTDNPNPNVFGNAYCNVSGKNESGKTMTGYDFRYKDIHYLEQEETNTTFFHKVNDGWIYTCMADEAGMYTLTIQELEIDEEYGKNKWKPAHTFQLEVKDDSMIEREYLQRILDECSSQNYKGDNLGNWEEMSIQEKLERLRIYVRENLEYPYTGAQTSLGGIPLWFVNINVGAYFDTGFADCGKAAEIMCKFANILGLEAKVNWSTTISAHLVAEITIDGEIYIYDATPWRGNFPTDWEYVL